MKGLVEKQMRAKENWSRPAVKARGKIREMSLREFREQSHWHPPSIYAGTHVRQRKGICGDLHKLVLHCVDMRTE